MCCRKNGLRPKDTQFKFLTDTRDLGLHLCTEYNRGYDSIVGIATYYRLEVLGIKTQKR